MTAARPIHPPADAEFWASCALFRDLDAPARALVAAAAVHRTWPVGGALFLRGDPGDYLVAVVSGQVRLSLTTAQGQELTLRRAGPRDVLGELALFDNQPRSADATAITVTTGMVLHRAAFERIMTDEPGVLPVIVRYLTGLLRDTNDRLEAIALYRLEARVARLFLSMLRHAHGPDLPDRARLRFDIPQGELAMMLGASRPKVNRALQSLIEAGAITRDGDDLVCDPALLEQMGEP